MAATLGTLLADPVTAENAGMSAMQRSLKCREQLAKIQEDINTENASTAAEARTEVLEEARRLEAERIHLNFRQNETSAVHQRRFQSRLPVTMEPARLFETPPAAMQGAGAGAPGTGPVIPQLTQDVDSKYNRISSGSIGSPASTNPVSDRAFPNTNWSLFKPG